MPRQSGEGAVAEVLQLVSNTRWSQAATDPADSADKAARIDGLVGGMDVATELTALCRGGTHSDESLEQFFGALRRAPGAGYGGAAEEGAGGARWADVGVRIVELTAHRRTTDTKASVCLSNLKLALPGMSGAALTQLVQALLKAVHDGSTASGKASPLEQLLPNVLDLIAKKATVPFTRGGGAALTITGKEYRRNALAQLISADLEGSMVTEVAKVLREVPLDADILQKFLAKCVAQFNALDLEAIPSLVYQLLLLVNRKDSVVKRLLLCSVCAYFDSLDARAQTIDDSERMSQTDSIRDPKLNTEELRSVEGTVILQINFAVTQDQKLGKDYLKLLNGAIAVSPFSLALLFSLSRISYLEDDAFKLLKSAVTSCHTDEARRAGSQWITKLHMAAEVSLKETLLKTVKNSAAGWDHITQSLVKFGFVLVDSTGAFGRSAAQEYASGIGFKIVVELFELHEMVRGEILEQCFTRIITHANSVDKVVTVLETLIKEQPQVMMSFTHQIKDLFDYVSSLSPGVAAQLLKAVQPLLRLRPELFDYVILVFRKAVFNKEPTSRLIAVTGFVELVQLADASVSNPVGGQSMSQDGELSHAEQTSKEMRMQAFGLFRRCLTQQYVVRERVYTSLSNMFDVSPGSREAIMELLAGQWSRYYRPKDGADDESPPFDLTECTHADKKGLVVEEPLSALIRCIHKCCCHSAVMSATSGADDDEEEDNPLFLLPKELWDATDRMATCSLDDFGLDEGTDVNLASEAGQRNAANVFLLQSVCEAIMECSVIPPVDSTMSLDVRVKSLGMQIFESLHSQLSAIAKPKAGGAGKGNGKRKSTSAAAAAASQNSRSQAPGGGGSGSGSKREQAYMSLPCITRCLESLTTHKDKGMANYQKLMIPFRSFVYRTCTAVLNKLAKTGCCSAADLKELEGLALALVKALQSHRDEALNGEDMDEGDKGKKKAPGAPPTVQALQCLSQVVLAVQTHFPSTKVGSEAKMRSLLSPCAIALDDDSSAETGRLTIYECCNKLGDLLVAMLADGNSKEPEILLGIMWTVASYMDERSSKQCSEWFDNLVSRNFKSNSTGACKAASRLILKLYEQQGDEYLKALRSVAVDLRVVFGSIPTLDDQRRHPQRYPRIVTEDSARTVVPILINAAQGVMDEVSWAFTKLKDLMVDVDEVEDDFVAAGGGGRRSSTGAASGLVGKIEAATHLRLDKLVEVIEPLTCIDMPNWTTTELVLRLVVKLFRELKAASKLLFTAKVHPPRSFKKLVHTAHKLVTTNVYVLLQYLNQGQSAATLKAAKKELALIPMLVFAMEDLEKELIKYGKQCKENLMRGFKRSTVRDFKIDDDKMIEARFEREEQVAADAAQEAEEEEEDEEEGEDEGGEEEEDSVAARGEEQQYDEVDEEDGEDDQAPAQFVDEEADGDDDSEEEEEEEEEEEGASGYMNGGRRTPPGKRQKRRHNRYAAEVEESPMSSVLPTEDEELLEDDEEEEDEEEEEEEDDDATQGEMDEDEDEDVNEENSPELDSGDDTE
eukprot:COSAG06_NODE_15_length_35009_cov_18.895417_2_plen_1524_part_00